VLLPHHHDDPIQDYHMGALADVDAAVGDCTTSGALHHAGFDINPAGCAVLAAKTGQAEVLQLYIRLGFKVSTLAWASMCRPSTARMRQVTRLSTATRAAEF
jgi:hypothetical protein